MYFKTTGRNCRFCLVTICVLVRNGTDVNEQERRDYPILHLDTNKSKRTAYFFIAVLHFTDIPELLTKSW